MGLKNVRVTHPNAHCYIMMYDVMWGQFDALPQNCVVSYSSSRRDSEVCIDITLLLLRRKVIDFIVAVHLFSLHSTTSTSFDVIVIDLFSLRVARLGWTDDIDFDLNTELTNNSYLNK